MCETSADVPGASRLCILIDLKYSRAEDGSGVGTVIDFVSAPWAVIGSFQIQPSRLIALLIRRLEEKAGVRLVSQPKKTCPLRPFRSRLLHLFHADFQKDASSL